MPPMKKSSQIKEIKAQNYQMINNTFLLFSLTILLFLYVPLKFVLRFLVYKKHFINIVIGWSFV